MSDLSDLSEPDREAITQFAKAWWVPVVVGVLLLLYSFIVLSFSIRTVWAVSIGLGVGLMVSGVGGLFTWRAATSWRWLALAMAIIDIVLAVIVFTWPGATFLVLARLVGWVLLIRGIIDILQSFEARRVGESGWWMLIVIGVFNIGIAFWATRYPGRSITILVLWVGIALLTRALVLIVAGFALRSAGKKVAAIA
jgi:uncharacterized membrane protein HdeD (DUF308 family)